jgi:SAM-dependent methyltransferase
MSWIRSSTTKTTLVSLFTLFQWLFLARVSRALNARNTVRRLEIGPGPRRLPGFETLSVIGGRSVDYIADASKRLPFSDQTFDLVHASHIIEHIPWYQTADALREWVRVMKTGGQLEVWTPDGLKIARAFVAAEDQGSTEFHLDGWWRFNEQQDPCLWMSGRCFSYGDGTGRANHPNWHRAAFSERHLRNLMTTAGLVDIRKLDQSDVRGHDHGWINLGLVGTKP